MELLFQFQPLMVAVNHSVLVLCPCFACNNTEYQSIYNKEASHIQGYQQMEVSKLGKVVNAMTAYGGH
jgi:tRNA 2-selenouridine synthase SelU